MAALNITTNSDRYPYLNGIALKLCAMVHLRRFRAPYCEATFFTGIFADRDCALPRLPAWMKGFLPTEPLAARAGGSARRSRLSSGLRKSSSMHSLQSAHRALLTGAVHLFGRLLAPCQNASQALAPCSEHGSRSAAAVCLNRSPPSNAQRPAPLGPTATSRKP
jgi:hypothetical protein